MVRVPNWWNSKKPPRPQITIAIGNADASALGFNSLLDFNMDLALPNGERLTLDELKDLITTQGQLVQVKGQWVEVDPDKLSQVLSHWQKVERQVKQEGLSFAEGLRLLAGVPGQHITQEQVCDVAQWSKVVEGHVLNKILNNYVGPIKQEIRGYKRF